MFNRKHRENTAEGPKLAFVKSVNVRVFPCGRRRGTPVTNSITKENSSIPFDPEARLNTEANNRKASSLNGYTQTFVKSWGDERTPKLALTLAGYSFEIDLPTSPLDGNVVKYHEVETFCTKLLDFLEEPAATTIYANVLLEEIPLYEGFTSYSTYVLRNQSDTSFANPYLDLLQDDSAVPDNSDEYTDKYYFSGLSFSTGPITAKELTRSEVSTESSEQDGKTRPQLKVSLRILEKKDGAWQIHQPALLPNIEHGETTESIKVSGVLNAGTVKQNGISVAIVEPVKQNNGKYVLTFSYDDKN